MKVNWKRIISLVLAACLLLGLLPAQAMAYYTPAGSKPVIQTANGALEPEDDWDEVYPYGAFALDAAELTLSEGGEGTITLYRLGGTTGRATVLVRYEPVVYANEDQSPNYANALSSGDVTIRVEETQSAAWYQPVGKAPDPLEPEGTVSVRQSRADENGRGTDALGGARRTLAVVYPQRRRLEDHRQGHGGLTDGSRGGSGRV